MEYLGKKYRSVKQFRDEVARVIGDKFIDSGIECTCIAVVLDFSKVDCNRIANALFASGNNFSKSRYLPVMSMSNMLAMDVAKYVHNKLVQQ